MNHTSVIDFRSLQKRFREPLVYSMLESLEPGGSITVVNDQDFGDLKQQLESIGFDDLSIVAQQDGPDLWTVTLTRELSALPKKSGCCGVCGGEGHHD